MSACGENIHEAMKLAPGLWLACRLLGFIQDRGMVLELRNCRVCDSTLAKRVRRRRSTSTPPCTV